jgi:homoserine dehydrogenase
MPMGSRRSRWSGPAPAEKRLLLARRLAQQKISLESIVQRHDAGSRGAAQPGSSAQTVPVILITYATSEDAVHKALAAVRRDRVVYGRPQVIRIERA